MRWSFKLFRVFGIQLAVHVTFLLLLAYWAEQGYQEGRATGAFWSTLLILAIFTCVVLHELGHSLTARRFGVGVRRILLMPIGGMAEFDSIPREPRKELLITAAGPAVNFVLAGLLYLAVDRSSGLPNDALPVSLGELGWCLLYWNLGMGLFNLVPVFPMDGGRILRALLALKFPYLKATYVAATIGKVLSAIAVLAAFYYGHYLVAALFLFIFFAGEAEYRALLRREREDAHWRAMLAQLNMRPPSKSLPCSIGDSAMHSHGSERGDAAWRPRLRSIQSTLS
jgi:Zn-dependent protease